MAEYGATPSRQTENTAVAMSPGYSSQSSRTKQPSPAKLTIPQKDLVVFFRQLAVILQSGIPLAQGLILIAENVTNPKLAFCVKRIAARLGSGDELSTMPRGLSRE